MSNKRFFTPLKQLRSGIKIHLPEKESSHITKSLRLKRGDKIEVFNGDEVFEAEIYAPSRESVVVRLLTRTDNLLVNKQINETTITAYLPLIKIPKLEVAIQKIVELGIDSIVIYKSEFSNVHEAAFTGKKVRFQKIITEACKQARIPKLIKLDGLLTFEQVLKDSVKQDAVLFPSTEVSGKKLNELKLKSPDNIAFIVGPEGGFSEKEISEASKLKRIEFITFGPYILRSETAAIAMVAVLQTLVNKY